MSRSSARTPQRVPISTARPKPISFAQLSVTQRSQGATIKLADKIEALGDQVVRPPGLEIEYGGQLFAGFALPESEILGILAAVIILLLAFGSVLAMGLPVGTALFGLGVGAGVLGIALQRVRRCPSSRRRWRQ